MQRLYTRRKTFHVEQLQGNVKTRKKNVPRGTITTRHKNTQTQKTFHVEQLQHDIKIRKHKKRSTWNVFARGIEAEPPSAQREGDEADSPTRGSEATEAARPKK
jgi:hypothetical protein